MTKYDLHCHSTASDGTLTPEEVIQRAQLQGVTSIALTDHDTIDGQEKAQKTALACNINYITGIEISTTWENMCFHIVGLNIDINDASLRLGIQKLQTLRSKRAKKIASKLEKNHIFNAYDAVIKIAQGSMITRTHFANFLLTQNHVSTYQEAFKRYLGIGKPAFVPTIWAELQDAVGWIRQAGGIAVVAHPLRYKLTANRIRNFLAFFKEIGGQGIEVVTGRSNINEIRQTMIYANQFNLVASVGSDFHTEKNKWVELGLLLPLPKNIQPVWDLF